jgi:secondary thiamine-phosphate synthase enzyme
MHRFTGKISLKTKPGEFQDITSLIDKLVKESKIKAGICHIFLTSTTSAIFVNECEDSLFEDIKRDIKRFFPPTSNYHHPVNAYSHLASMFMGISATLPIVESELYLGTWQRVLFIEWDVKPRNREILVQILGEK